MTDEPLQPGDSVWHGRYGIGVVAADMGATVVVRFKHGIEEVAKSDLERTASLEQLLTGPSWNVPLEVINRIQAECIVSINNAWGVFARSRIALLPHQLWVCREVNNDWPTCWLVADDVGLGKTIEAGLILTPLLSGGRVQRLLILCPAKLVEQWQQRLRTLFDIRLAIYTPEADTARTDFWHTHHQVVVSLHTLRADHRGRHGRLLEADPWDLLVVDESHHLNADEKSGPTLAYQLVKNLGEHKRIRSMIFLTGTPHRGKTFGFLALLHLLRPDLFDPRRPLVDQLPNLSRVIIRNNKYNVTDLRGKRLFQEPTVHMETYDYSQSEQVFYDTLTDFIRQGRAYASRLPQADQSAVVLVLIAMQKLASSSVAAIRRALRGRLNRITRGRNQVRELQGRIHFLEQLDEIDAADEIAVAVEQIAELASELQLMENEEPALQNLLALAESIRAETKIVAILEVVERRFPDRSILFFTEYKATQSLLMTALLQRFGLGCVTFINGDERADGVEMPDGTVRSIRKGREEAAHEFNTGKSRFLVSTEAGGEGIDLQTCCHTLIHVDLPWNPMRMHQRVGRLNRYGQKNQVEVVSVRNPSTVESRIWDKLEEKLDRINEAFSQVMDTPEDLKQLVLGMASAKVFERIFSDAVEAPRQRFDHWFDDRTATLGGKDVVEVVKALVGNVNRFDFQEVSSRLPKVDLPDLRPFLEIALALNSRQLIESEGTCSFLTPESWRGSPAVRERYQYMSFNRQDTAPDAAVRLLGVGHKVLDAALDQALGYSAALATLPREVLNRHLIVMRIRDRITGDSSRFPVIVGVELSEDQSSVDLLADWVLLQRLNSLSWRKRSLREGSSAPANPETVLGAYHAALKAVRAKAGEFAPKFRFPDCEIIAIFWQV